MPLIIAKRAGTCSAAHCGGAIRKGEQAWYTAEMGLRHPEPGCRLVSASPHRANARAGTCSGCGRHVPAQQGRLVLAGEEKRGEHFVKKWNVLCSTCA